MKRDLAPHIIWGELTPYNRICPDCDARYMGGPRYDGMIDVKPCAPCVAKRRMADERRRLYDRLKVAPVRGREEGLEARLLELGGRLPPRRMPEEERRLRTAAIARRRARRAAERGVTG